MFSSAKATSIRAIPEREPQAVSDMLVRLLVRAGHAVAHDQDEALRCIREASILARAWCNRGEAPETVRYQGGLAAWQLQRIYKYVDENLDSNVSIKELAKYTCLSESYFCHAFRRSLGKSPHRYVTERRIIRAQKMMIDTDQTLSVIALECGLADQPHLTRLFRRHVGASPALWRKSHRAQRSLTSEARFGSSNQ